MATTQITLTGNYGTTTPGFVDIRRPMALTLTGTVYPPFVRRVALVSGAFSLAVDATDDTGVTPLNAYYTITEYLNGSKTEKNIFVPAASSGATLDVNTATPVTVAALIPPAADSIGTIELKDSAVAETNIVNGAVSAAKLLDADITPAKLDRAYVPVASSGTAVLVAGTVVVSNTAITASTIILLTHQNTAGTAGFVKVSARSVGASFTILSSNAADTSTIGYLLIEP